MQIKQLTFVAAALIPSAMGHIGAWIESGYGFEGDGYTIVEPLANLPFDRWWFHGQKNRAPKAKPLDMPAGGKTTIQLSCNKRFTSFGGGNTNDPCPSDTPSMHAGTPVQDNLLLGCGLAIAYKSNVNDVKPEDFTVFSVNTQCVKTLRTDFQIPKDMPPCPNGKCICAWFWQGQNSANEMYMNGFDCNITGGNANSRVGAGKPPVYCKGNQGACVKGPKQPMYWANDRSNVQVRGYNEKPAYNPNWGYSNGAQNDIFVGGGSGGSNNNTPAQPPAQPTTLQTSTRRATATAKPPAQPTQATCSWPGHCAGATCRTENDCSDDLICISGKCGKD